MARIDSAQYSALKLDGVPTRAARAETAEMRALAAFAGDRDRAASFAERELGPIELLGPRSARLLVTLEGFLAHGQRIANASAVSGQHRDTVHRHLREVEEAIGCSVEERSAELLWALRLRRALSDSNCLTRLPR